MLLLLPLLLLLLLPLLLLLQLLLLPHDVPGKPENGRGLGALRQVPGGVKKESLFVFAECTNLALALVLTINMQRSLRTLFIDAVRTAAGPFPQLRLSQR